MFYIEGTIPRSDFSPEDGVSRFLQILVSTHLASQLRRQPLTLNLVIAHKFSEILFYKKIMLLCARALVPALHA